MYLGELREKLTGADTCVVYVAERKGDLKFLHGIVDVTWTEKGYCLIEIAEVYE